MKSDQNYLGKIDKINKDVLNTLKVLGLNQDFDHLTAERAVEPLSLQKLRSKLRQKETLPKLPLKDLEVQYADSKTPERLRKAISALDDLVKQCRKVLLTSFDRKQDLETKTLLETSDQTNVQALDELIESLDNQLNPDQKISLDLIRQNLLFEKNGNQAYIKKEMKQMYDEFKVLLVKYS